MITQAKTTWRKVRLGDICRIKTGKTDVQDAVENGRYPLFDRSVIIKRSDKFLFDTSAIILPGEGKEFMPRFYSGKFDLHQRVYAIYCDEEKKGNDLNLKFLYYFLLLNRDYFSQTATGATVKSLRLPIIADFPVILPSISDQKQIADVLSTYDDLIENNSRRIQILEQMAQEIYKEWFVNFRFPGHEKVKMIDSGTDFGKIPEGWEIEKVKDFVDFARGFEPGSKNYQEQHGEGLIPFLRVGDLGNRQSKIFIKKELVGDRVLNKDDIVISMDGSVGIVRMGLEGAYSSGIRKIIIKSKALNKPFVWQLLLSEDIQNIIKEHARGTTILHAGESINQMEFVLSTDRIMKEFFDKEELIMKLLSDLTDQNQNLRRTRDLLLPKLVTGEIEVR